MAQVREIRAAGRPSIHPSRPSFYRCDPRYAPGRVARQDARRARSARSAPRRGDPHRAVRKRGARRQGRPLSGAGEAYRRDGCGIAGERRTRSRCCRPRSGRFDLDAAVPATLRSFALASMPLWRRPLAGTCPHPERYLVHAASSSASNRAGVTRAIVPELVKPSACRDSRALRRDARRRCRRLAPCRGGPRPSRRRPRRHPSPGRPRCSGLPALLDTVRTRDALSLPGAPTRTTASPSLSRSFSASSRSVAGSATGAFTASALPPGTSRAFDRASVTPPPPPPWAPPPPIASSRFSDAISFSRERSRSSMLVDLGRDLWRSTPSPRARRRAAPLRPIARTRAR